MFGKDMEVCVWGTRGSCAIASEEFLQYGANTCCMSVKIMDTYFIFDAGTGILNLGRKIEQELKSAYSGNPKPVKKKFYLFLGHFHLDHLAGLPLFIAMVKNYADVCIIGCPGLAGENTVQAVLDKIITSPAWPVRISDISPDGIEFYDIKPEEEIFLAHDVKVCSVRADHPDGGVLYSLSCNGRKVGYGVDHEIKDEASEQTILSLAQDCDLLVFDGTYTRDDYRKTVGYGHSYWELAAEIAQKTNVKKIGIDHYNWIYTDIFLQQEERKAAEMDSRILFLREQMCFKL